MEFAATLVDEFGDAAREIRLGHGDVLVTEGDEAAEVFFVLAGSLQATTTTAYGELVVGTIDAGAIVGEVTTIAGGRRTATLRADGDVTVLVIARADFERWLDEHPAYADSVSAQARERIDRSQVATMVTDLMQTNDDELIQEVVDRVGWRRLDAGDTLFEQGDESDAAYFIVGGRLIVLVRDDDGNDELVREIGRTEVVGELGLLDRRPRSATVRAVRDTTLAAFPTALFEELVSKSPALMLHVTRGILGRATKPRRLIDRAASVTVAVTSEMDTGPLLDSFVTEVARHGTVRHLSSRRVDQLLNRTDIAQATVDNVGVPRLAEFMHEADVGNDYVVLEADREMTPWTRRALRQADRLVLVSSPHPDAAERARMAAVLAAIEGSSHVARMLAVLHPAGTDRPRNTSALLREFTIDEVVHVRVGSTDDAARLARLASGNGVGLVLSGGGARGFAHIGAYLALREAGVPIDQVAGCSMGAPISGGIAIGTPDDRLVEEVQAQFRRLLDYTLPMVSLIKGERISGNIDATFGDWAIEDMWLPYYTVSTNLTTSQMEVHRRGDAALAIRASVAIPGVLPPVPYGGDLLVDGGVLNNLPTEVMSRDATIGTIIAVDVAPELGPRSKLDYGSHVSGFRALAAKLRGRGRDYPSLSAVLLRSMLTGAVRNQQAALQDGTVDLLLSLHLPGVGLLDFDRVRPVADVGYEASIDAVREWAADQPWLRSPA
ncbi:MAG: cyclic nucleotide-binding domain-containing protein [Ilumatobacter sp.]|nr:cyclic nucleotide-binding domain-containing protein [Ilumatobacter sp.]